MSEITAIKGAVKAAKAASKASDGFKLHVYKGKSFLLPDYLTDEQVKFILWKKVDAPQQAGREEKIDLPSELPKRHVAWDSNEGAKAVPMQGDTDFTYYNGFVRKMAPTEFLGLTKDGGRAVRATEKDNPSFIPTMIEEMGKGKKFAPPWFSVQWDPTKKAWRITGHEGRHRAYAAGHAAPDDEVPVQIIPHDEEGRKYKGDRRLTEEQKAAPLLKEF